jgi:tetratricopeptide (TPR) repeat protein
MKACFAPECPNVKCRWLRVLPPLIDFPLPELPFACVEAVPYNETFAQGDLAVISRGESVSRASALYEKRLNPQSTQEMRGLLEASHHETAVLHATTLLCDYLNRWNEAGPEEVAKAEAAALQALGSNPSHALAHYAKGFVHRTRGEHEAALAAFTETLKHVPDFARAHAQRGAQLLYLGRPQEAIAEVEKALEISPRSAQRGMFYWIIGRARFFMGQYAEAIPWLRRSIRLWPHLWYNRLYLASAYALAGRRAAASRALREFEREFPGYTLSRVTEHERTNPNDNPFVVAGRDQFHEGLRRAGMSSEAA